MKKISNFIYSLAPFIFLALPLIIIFWQVFFKGYVFMSGDNFDLNIPLKDLLIDSLKRGQFPFWNPYIFAGIPYAADLNLGVFNPLNFLYVFFSSARALTLQSIVDLFLIGCFQYIFLRQMQLAKLTSLLGAAIFMLSGSVFSFTGNSAILHPIVFIPLLFYFAKRFLDQRDTRTFVYLCIVQFLQIISGHPQITYYTMFFICLFFLFNYQGNFIRRIILITSYIFLSITLSSFLLFPFVQYALEANRPTTSLAYATTGSMSLSRPLIVFFPTFFGTTLAGDWWGLQAMLLGYIGVASLLLLCIGIVKGKLAQKSFYLFALFLSFLLSFGTLGIVYVLFYYVIPGWSLFRSPGDLIVMTTFFASIVAASGFAYLPKLGKVVRQKLLKISIVTFFLCTLVLLILFLTNTIFPWTTILRFLYMHHVSFVQRILFYSPPKIQSMLHGITWNVCIFFLFLTISLLLMMKIKKLASITGICLLVLITFDLLLVDRTNIQLAPEPFYQVHVPDLLKSGNYRIFSQPVVIPQDRRFLPGPQYFYQQAERNLQDITDNHAVSANVLSITGYTSLVLKRYAAYVHSKNITGITPSLLTQNNLNNLSVKYSISQGQKSPSVKENPDVLPRGRLKNTTKGSANILSSMPNTVTIAVQSQMKNTLILADSFYPGWKVLVNGKEEVVKPYNNVFREVAVPKGKSTVLFFYDPFIWKIGTAASCIGFLLCIILLLHKKYE